MHAIILLHRWLGATCPFIHSARLNALLLAIGALLEGQRLTLTDLGRHVPGQARAKHGIKRIDRLLGNAHLHRERPVICQAMAAWLLGANPRPIILVDWADLTVVRGRRYLTLRAALAYRGRSVTLYDEVHTLDGYNTPRTHRRFLQRLGQIVPPACRPIVVTDAGFRGPWFLAVEALGWDWIGRVRNAVNYSDDKGESWQLTTTLYPSATAKLRSVGRCLLGKRRPYAATLYLIRKYRRGPGRPKRRHGHSDQANVARRRHKEPWLLATSLVPSPGLGRRVVKWYARRMQIELSFRDAKGTRWGWQLAYSGSRRVERLNVLLLIEMLATFVSWLVGLAADRHDWVRQMQANTERKRRVLSAVFVGRYLLTRPPPWLGEKAVLDSVMELPTLLSEPA